MTKEEIKQLEERVYAIGSSLFPIDVFFNDIRDNKNSRYNKDRAYEDLKLIIDEIYRLRDKEKPKKPIIRGLSVAIHCCPVCDKELIVTNDEIVIYKTKTNYCDNCGQKIDWSDDND